jgi:hypothetical protein
MPGTASRVTREALRVRKPHTKPISNFLEQETTCTYQPTARLRSKGLCNFIKGNIYVVCIDRNPDSSVGIATGCRLNGLSSFPNRTKILLFSTTSYQAYYPIGTGVSFCGSKATGSVKLTTQFHLVTRSRMVEIYLPYPLRHYGLSTIFS